MGGGVHANRLLVLYKLDQFPNEFNILVKIVHTSALISTMHLYKAILVGGIGIYSR
jgi:hypothetical protein